MIKLNIYKQTGSIHINNAVEGEPIEKKVSRMVNNKEPIKDSAPILYTDRKDGVLPETDIRTDRFDIAIDAMDKVAATHIGRREERIKNKKIAENLAKGLDADGKPIQGTEGQNKS